MPRYFLKKEWAMIAAIHLRNKIHNGIQAAKDIKDCKDDILDLSGRDLGDEGVMKLVEELKVCLFVACFVVDKTVVQPPRLCAHMHAGEHH
jgi:hypothetical protein